MTSSLKFKISHLLIWILSSLTPKGFCSSLSFPVCLQWIVLPYWDWDLLGGGGGKSKKPSKVGSDSKEGQQVETIHVRAVEAFPWRGEGEPVMNTIQPDKKVMGGKRLRESNSWAMIRWMNYHRNGKQIKKARGEMDKTRSEDLRSGGELVGENWWRQKLAVMAKTVWKWQNFCEEHV